MSGLVKAKKYDWKDSNLALFGSDTEKQVKKESAEQEEKWHSAGQEPGLQIWRIESFQVEDWPKEEYGRFYNGDSYIILNTYQKDDSEELLYDVHFWIGKNSSQDEYGTAAYKTVELDTYLDDKPVQHREVMGHESEMFRSYFKTIQTMEGGAKSGFRHVEPEQYQPRLLRFNGQRKTVTIREVPLLKSKLNSGDVYILDMGKQIYQWNGTDCNKDERFKAMQYVQELESERGGASTEVLDEDSVSKSHEFYEALGDGDPEEDESDEETEEEEKVLMRYTEGDGSEVKRGDITSEDLVSNDVFLIDTGKEVFVWVGADASPNEKKNGFSYAHSYLKGKEKSYPPVTIVKEGQTNAALEMALSA
ncbi:gelsolin-like protein 1 [Liolophura sinensis]|uniref:gelsolin-like protein 1 n=1 Tax=Liolophura sinensis TaxID=3198878 RepID=UPI003158F701